MRKIRKKPAGRQLPISERIERKTKKKPEDQEEAGEDQREKLKIRKKPGATVAGVRRQLPISKSKQNDKATKRNGKGSLWLVSLPGLTKQQQKKAKRILSEETDRLPCKGIKKSAMERFNFCASHGCPQIHAHWRLPCSVKAVDNFFRTRVQNVMGQHLKLIIRRAVKVGSTDRLRRAP
jgi:hypothetical protein